MLQALRYCSYSGANRRAPKMNLHETIEQMQAIAAPVVAVETADQITTAWSLRKKLNEAEEGKRAVFIWDCVNGLRPFSKAAEAGFAAILEALPKGGPPGAA